MPAKMTLFEISATSTDRNDAKMLKLKQYTICLNKQANVISYLDNINFTDTHGEDETVTIICILN